MTVRRTFPTTRDNINQRGDYSSGSGMALVEYVATAILPALIARQPAGEALNHEELTKEAYALAEEVLFQSPT